MKIAIHFSVDTKSVELYRVTLTMCVVIKNIIDIHFFSSLLKRHQGNDSHKFVLIEDHVRIIKYLSLIPIIFKDYFSYTIHNSMIHINTCSKEKLLKEKEYLNTYTGFQTVKYFRNRFLLFT